MEWRLMLLGIVCVVPIDLLAVWLLELRKVEMYWKSGAEWPPRAAGDRRRLETTQFRKRPPECQARCGPRGTDGRGVNEKLKTENGKRGGRPRPAA
jgi:hypothetical protein